jgi:hypothetical protein
MGRLHGIPILDDDWATAGTALTAADFIEGENTVISRDFGKGPDTGVLVDILMMVTDTVAVSTGCKSRLELQPTDWTTPMRIVHPADVGRLVITDSAAATQALPGNSAGADGCNYSLVRDRYGSHPKASLVQGMSWVAGNSKLFATTANEDAAAVLYVYYPTGNGVNPAVDPKTNLPYVDVRIGPKAIASDGTAEDIFSVGTSMINEQLNDESPGIYTDHNYAIVGIGVEPEGAADAINQLVRCAPAGQENCWLYGMGNGTVVSPCWTYFTFGVPVMSGVDYIKVQVTEGTANKPNVYIALQDISARGVAAQQLGKIAQGTSTVNQAINQAMNKARSQVAGGATGGPRF